MEDLNDKVSNTYIIRRRLAELKRAPQQSHYEYYTDKFKLVIHTDRVQEHNDNPDDNIVHHAVLDVSVYEIYRKDPSARLWDWVHMYRDSRFMNYEPIKYGERNTRCDGGSMPLDKLCELIKYLHKLDKLSAFM